MNRVVFQLAGSVGMDNQQYVSISLEQPPDEHAIDRPFACESTDPVFAETVNAVLAADAIKQAGNRLFSAVTQHPEVGTYLQSALATQDDRYEVYVEIAPASGAEVFPWETMCSPAGDFLALDKRFALARQVRSKGPEIPFHQLTPPVRVAAVLSCLGVTADGELDALREAAAVMDQGQVELLVVASEPGLVSQLRQEVEDGTAPEIRAVELMPTDNASLYSLISGFGPHLLHFFCHGSLEDKPHLELAVKSDWETPNPSRGLWVEASQFSNFKQKTDDLPWLVVLNCCEGAAPGPSADAHSLALSVAFQGVAPAVVGMREPVVSDVANALTAALYRQLFSDLRRRIEQGSGEAEVLDWAALAVPARERLALSKEPSLTKAAASTKEWTLPVVYVRPQDFRLQVAPQPPNESQAREARLEIAAALTMLKSLQPGQGEALRTALVDRIIQLSVQLGVDLPPDVLVGDLG